MTCSDPKCIDQLHAIASLREQVEAWKKRALDSESDLPNLFKMTEEYGLRAMADRRRLVKTQVKLTNAMTRISYLEFLLSPAPEPVDDDHGDML